MNLIKKIKLANKVSKAIKEIKKFLNETHLEADIKENVATIKKCVENIISKAPQLKEAYLTILEILK